MSKRKSTKIVAQSSKSLSGWDKAIYDADGMIQDLKKRIADLRRAIRTFEDLRDSGQPFPGEGAKERGLEA